MQVPHQALMHLGEVICQLWICRNQVPNQNQFVKSFGAAFSPFWFYEFEESRIANIDIDEEGDSTIDILSSDSVTSEFLIDNSSSPVVLLSEKNCWTADCGGNIKSANKPKTGDDERRRGGTYGGTVIRLSDDDVEKVVE